MASAEIELQRERRVSRSALRLLPPRARLTLFVLLAVTLAATFAALAYGWTLALLVVTVVDVALIVWVARLMAAEASRQDATRELSDLSTHLQSFTEKEKSELARHLHDELGGLLTAAKMDLSWMQSRMKDPPMEQRLTQLGNVLDEAMDLKRRVVEDLRPSLLEHFGLPTALRAHHESTCAQAGLECELDMPDVADGMPKEVAIALFRVVQEGMTNIVRHAEARRVKLAIHPRGDRYLLMLTDDGRGMDLNATSFRWSHGLAGMRHRVRSIGGTFDLESSRSQGTTLRVEVPRRVS